MNQSTQTTTKQHTPSTAAASTDASASAQKRTRHPATWSVEEQAARCWMQQRDSASHELTALPEALPSLIPHEPRALSKLLQQTLAHLHLHKGRYELRGFYSGDLASVDHAWPKARSNDLKALIQAVLGISAHLRATYGISFEEGASGL